MIPALDFDGDIPVYLQIKTALAEQIRRGALPVGRRLPATRDLARQLGVNRGTVTMAYDELAADGYLESHVGRGTFVAEPETHHGNGKGNGSSAAKPQRMAWEGVFSSRAESPVVRSLLDLYQVSTLRDVISFSGSFPDGGSFPIKEFRNSLQYVARTMGEDVLRYGPAAGFEPLRQHLASEMRAEGARVSPDDILLTNGSQQSLDLIARILVSPGDTVVLENPTYPGAVNAFTLAGARLIGVPVDEEGMRTDLLEHIVALNRPKLIYVVPSFQNPTGACLGFERRRQLLTVAREYGVPIVEDDYGSKLRFEGEPMPILKAQDPGDYVIYVSSFSKNLIPGLRVGWCAAPAPVVERMTALKQNSDITSSALLHAALWDFCRRNRRQAHLEHVRPVYRERRDLVVKLLESEFPPDTVWTRPEGGLFLWVTLPRQVDATELLLTVRQQGVVFSRGHLFYTANPVHNTLRLSYGNVTPGQIETGLKILGRAVRGMVARNAERTPDKFRTRTVPLV